MTVVSEPEKVYEALDAMGIQYDKYDHPPVYTSEEAAEHWGPIQATQVKNLFLRNKKGNRQYLVILEISKQAAAVATSAPQRNAVSSSRTGSGS